MKNRLLTVLVISTVSMNVMADVNLVKNEPRVIEYHYGEDVAMWRGDNFNPSDRENVIPMVVEGEHSPICKHHAFGAVEYLFIGSDSDNICNYPTTTDNKVDTTIREYCNIAINDRGGDIDLELANEQGCF